MHTFKQAGGGERAVQPARDVGWKRPQDVRQVVFGDTVREPWWQHERAQSTGQRAQVCVVWERLLKHHVVAQRSAVVPQVPGDGLNMLGFGGGDDVDDIERAVNTGERTA
jgi:hypothetical protein